MVYNSFLPLKYHYTLVLLNAELYFKTHYLKKPVMKKILILAAAVMISTSMVYAEPESKMEKSFKETFPSATNVKWHQDKEGYLVSFTQGNMPVKIAYSNKGKFVQSLRYYSEKDLPTSVIIAVKNKYHDKKIFGVTECTTANDVTYHIALYDGTTLQNITATGNGSLKEDNAPAEDEDSK